MTDKVKRGLGDNSKNNSDYISMYEKNAVKEMMTVMKMDPNPTTNKKKLRKKYKPAKLSKVELAEVGQSIERDIDRVVETVTDIEGTVNAYEDPDTFQEWIEAEKEKEVK